MTEFVEFMAPGEMEAAEEKSEFSCWAGDWDFGLDGWFPWLVHARRMPPSPEPRACVCLLFFFSFFFFLLLAERPKLPTIKMITGERSCRLV